MKVAIIGGFGFVGKNVFEYLEAQHVDVIRASRRTNVDITKPEQFVTWLESTKPDVIVNCAAHVGSLNYVSQQAADILLDNSRILMGLYEGVQSYNQQCIIINPVANCVYPDIDEAFYEQDLWTGPVHPSVYAYGASRRFLLLLSKSFEMQFGIRSLNLLVPNMYGPYDSVDPNKAHALNALISRFVKAEQTNIPVVKLWGTGIAIREWLYAGDFARIIDYILKHKLDTLTTPLNIAQNFGLSVANLVEIITKNFDFQFQVNWDKDMPNGAPKKVMNNEKFREDFIDFEFTDLKLGIVNTIEYYRSIYPY